MPFDIENNEDQGIFAQFPHANDPDAKEEMEANAKYVAPIIMGDAEGRLPIPEIDDVGLFDELPPVSYKNFKCNIGPCKYYTEIIVKTPSGPMPDAEDLYEIKRWCGRLRTWAEQTDITDLDVLSCNCYSPIQNAAINPETTLALQHNLEVMKEARDRAIEVNFDYGICVHGPCENYFEMICRKIREDREASLRYCVELAGLGRLYTLLDEPVMACNKWKPLAFSDQMTEVAKQNIELLHRLRIEMSKGRNGNDHG